MPKSFDRRSRSSALRTLLACAVPTALLSLAASALAGQDSQGAITAFVGVNVVPMDADRVLRNQTVLVENGTIVAVGRRIAAASPARMSTPPSWSMAHSGTTTCLSPACRVTACCGRIQLEHDALRLIC